MTFRSNSVRKRLHGRVHWHSGEGTQPCCLEDVVLEYRGGDVNRLGRAIHAAKKVGGPWGPACGYVEPRYAPDGLSGENVFVEVEYNEVALTDEYACLCQSMAKHLIELMND